MKTQKQSSPSATVCLGLIVASIGLTAIESQAQPSSVPLASFWRTDGPVYAVAANSNIFYVGGQFTYVGPYTGGAGVVDATNAAAKPGFPVVNGAVYSAAPDGNGGWYIGGSFWAVGGIVRSNIAHVLADNSVDPAWNPTLNGSNVVIAVSGSTVYIGGSFTRVGAVTVRNRIAALNATTGLPTDWNPNASAVVNAIVPIGSLLYVGGSFTTIGSQSRARIAALEASTGLATTWNPGASAGTVNAIVVSGTNVYVGGTFTTAGARPRQRIAKLSTASDTASSWIADANGAVSALAVLGNTVYAGGQFTSIGSDSRNWLAALDADSALATAWNPAPSTNVNALLISDTNIFVGGGFKNIDGQARTLLASFDTTTGTLNAWNPGLSGLLAGSTPQVYAMSAGGNEVLAGGTISSVGGVTRGSLAALDITTGRATAWDPNASGLVSALAIGPDTVYVGGTFTSIGGLTRRRLAAVHSTSGVVLPFDPNVLGRATVGVFALVTDGASRLYVGGNFTNIAGTARNSIAVFNSGSLTTLDPNAQGTAPASASASVNALLLAGNTLYVGGDFVNISGQPRARIAALDTATSAATPWNPAASNAVTALALSGTNLYVGGSFTNIGGQLRGRVAAISTNTGLATSWNPNAGVTSPQVRALAAAGKSIYAGGQFTQVGGEFRNRLAGLSLNNGQAHSWNPDANAMVRVIYRTLDALYVGGDFTTIGGEPQTYFAVFPAATDFVPGSLQRQPNGDFTGTLISADGNRVIIQATTDFSAWSNVSTNEPGGFLINFTDTGASGFPYRFYRAILETE